MDWSRIVNKKEQNRKLKVEGEELRNRDTDTELQEKGCLLRTADCQQTVKMTDVQPQSKSLQIERSKAQVNTDNLL